VLVVYHLLPAALDLPAHLRKWPPVEVPRFHPDDLVRLLNLVAELPASNRKLAKKVRQHGGFVPISSQLAQAMVRHYNQYLNYAVRTGIVETDDRWWPAGKEIEGKCRGYRFAPAYCRAQQPGAGALMQLVRLTDPKRIAKARQQARTPARLTKEEKREHWVRMHRHEHLLQWLGPQTLLRIDQAAAMAYIAAKLIYLEQYPEEGRRKQAGWKAKWAKEADLEHYIRPVEQHTQRQRSIIRLAGQELWPSIDTTAGRLHTTLTNMSSELRQFVTVEGYGPLVAIDLVNSQPYLANVLLQPGLYHQIGQKSATARSRNFRRTSLREIEKEVGTQAIMLANVLQNSKSEDVSKFAKFTSSGQFYEVLAQEFTSQGETALQTRTALKELVFQVLFTKNGYSSASKRAFRVLFPTVDQVFRIVKQHDHATLARLLQTVEADLFLHVIGKRITKELAGVPVFTIHDSLVVPQEYADQVEIIMREELSAAVGLPPTLKRETWGLSKARVE
jgi:hypothetical protein